MQANVLGVIAVIASNFGWPQAYWRPWWLAVGIAIWVVAYLWVGRWVCERYSESVDPLLAHEVRTAVDRSIGATGAGNQLASGVFALFAVAFALRDKPRSPWLLFLLIALTHFHGAFRRLRRLNETEAESSPNVTR
jgi:hypothetical protein